MPTTAPSAPRARPTPTVVIVGAGIVGASCAYHLAARGARVTVLERAGAPATGSTGRSAAGIRHQFSLPANVQLSLLSAAEYREFERLTGVDAGYRKVGYLFLVPPARLPSWREEVAMQQALGAKVELLEPSELANRFPYLTLEGVAAGSFGADDGVLDPHAITLGYLRAARTRGATVALETEVMALERRRGCWQVETSRGRYQADLVINAAGPWAGELAARAGLEVPVVPVRRNVYVTSPQPAFAHPTPLIIDLTSGVYLRSEGERFLFGRSRADEPPGDNLAVDWGWLEPLLELALPRFPFLAAAGLDRAACWAGLYEITPDHLPILGRMPTAEGFLNACGFSGHGVQHAAATGRLIAEEALDGEAHSLDIAPFRITRLQSAPAAAEANIV